MRFAQTPREISEVVNAWGHVMVRSTHKTTFEVTKETALTERGDCIIAVGADKGAADLNPKFKEYARREGSKIIVTIEAGGAKEVVEARGDPRLTFTNPKEMVVRRSTYVCGRTVAVKADKAAGDLSRRLVEKLRNPDTRVKITLTVRVS